MKLAILTATAGADSLTDAMESWGYGGDALITKPLADGVHMIEYPESTPVPLIVVNGQDGMLKAYQRGLEVAPKEYDVLAYVHDDCLVLEEGWKDRVLAEFDDPKVGLVGFGGSQTHGSPDLYRAPYHISQLSRGKFLSNAADAEVHGYRYEGLAIDVATLDGYALIFRRELLERARGWPVDKLSFHGYDFWATCMAHRLGYRVRLVPIKMLHLGGRTSVVQKLDPAGSHEAGHRFIYESCVDVLPWSCL